MTDFVKALLESTVADDNTNDDVTVEECLTPISTLIESAVADFDIAMTDATEVYEMACIVGGAKIVSEGAGQSEAATLLEAASGNFFSKIADFFKKIGQKIAEIWGILMEKVKSIGKNSQKTFNKYRAAAKEKLKNAEKEGKEIPLPENFKVIDIATGEKEFEDIVKNDIDSYSDVDKTLDKYGMGASDEWNEEESAALTGLDWSSVSTVAKGMYGIDNVSSIEDLKKYVVNKYSGGSTGTTLTATMIDTFTTTVDLAASEDVARSGKMCKMIQNGAKKMEKGAEAFSKKAPDSDKAKKLFASAQAMISMLTNISMTIINTRASIIINAATAYANFIKGVATGKITPVGGKAEQQAATDGVDYSVFFEGYDIVEEGCDGEDCDSEDEEDDDVEEGCKKSSMESCSILDIAKMLI